MPTGGVPRGIPRRLGSPVAWDTCTRACERRYVYIQPKLGELIGLEDTCGIHNLHAMPGFLGGTRH